MVKAVPKDNSKSAPTPAPLPSRPIRDGQIFPRIGFAFGSGAAKAICQFGVIKRLVEKKIPISYVSGSSMGAVIGGIFAMGLDIDLAVEKSLRYAEASNINNLANLNVLHESVYKRDYTDNLLKELFADFTFEECKIPFAVTSVDLESGKVVLLNKGPLVPAIRASTSIPGVFEPVLMDGHYLVDGGLLEDCPVSAMRQLCNCDLLLGCSISDQRARQNISGYIYNKFYRHKAKLNFLRERLIKIQTDVKLLGAIVLRSIDILREELWSYKLKEAAPDLMINIDIEKVTLFDFKKTKDLIKIGEKAFDENYEKILALIEAKKKELNQK